VSFENLRTKRSIYIYELDRMFDSAEEVSKILDLNADDVTESLIYRKGEIAGHFHVTYSSIRNAIKLRNGNFRNVHLEYVKE